MFVRQFDMPAKAGVDLLWGEKLLGDEVERDLTEQLAAEEEGGSHCHCMLFTCSQLRSRRFQSIDGSPNYSQANYLVDTSKGSLSIFAFPSVIHSSLTNFSFSA